MVLVDDAAEYLSAPHLWAGRHEDWPVLVGRHLVPGLVQSVPVVMPDVGPQHCPQMRLRWRSACGSYIRTARCVPTVRIPVRPRRLRRDLDDRHALAVQHSIERVRELRVAVPVRNRKEPIRSARSMTRLRVCWVAEAPSRMGGYPADVHPPGGYLHEEQHIQAPEEDCVHSEEITRQQAFRACLTWDRPVVCDHVVNG